MHLDFKTIDKRVWDNYPRFLEDYGYTKDSNKNGDIGLATDIAQYHFSEMNSRMRDKLSILGWHIDSLDDKVLIYDIRTIDRVRALTNKVQDAYDAGRFIRLWQYILFYPYWRWFYTNDRAWSSACKSGSLWLTPKWADRFWVDEMEFGGDDDVDYNGTYLDIVVDMVEIAHRHSSGKPIDDFDYRVHDIK